MKALLIRTAAGLIALGALLYSSACSPTPPASNANHDQNQNSSDGNQADGNKSMADLRPCDDYGSGHGAHSAKIKKDIEDKMRPRLKKLLKGPNNPNGTFTVEVQKATNGSYYVAYIKGKVSGDDNLKDLSNILNDFQNKQDCLRVVYFMSAPGSVTADEGPGFEWSSCEYPMMVCPNGECCLATSSTVETSAKTSTNSNSNSGGGSNSNSNGNSNGAKKGDANK